MDNEAEYHRHRVESESSQEANPLKLQNNGSGDNRSMSVCSSCGKISEDKVHWSNAETPENSALSNHLLRTICPACSEKKFPKFYK